MELCHFPLHCFSPTLNRLATFSQPGQIGDVALNKVATFPVLKWFTLNELGRQTSTWLHQCGTRCDGEHRTGAQSVGGAFQEALEPDVGGGRASAIRRASGSDIHGELAFSIPSHIPLKLQFGM